MSQLEGHPITPTTPSTPSQEFAAYCEAEFERSQNSGGDFDEHHYRKAMNLVIDKLRMIEGNS